MTDFHHSCFLFLLDSVVFKYILLRQSVLVGGGGLIEGAPGRGGSTPSSLEPCYNRYVGRARFFLSKRSSTEEKRTKLLCVFFFT